MTAADFRIIPARAGFTVGVHVEVSVFADHPRSRGVYVVGGAAEDPPSGSSPLARGLRPCDQGCRPVRGIIPARAGFTALRCGAFLYARDHPRSRGVYKFAVWRWATTAGSSPLARGLLMARPVSTKATGIIPARAGFTGPVPTRAPARPDHPRSRGVYCVGNYLFAAFLGSSPLARGLLESQENQKTIGRIIPARAGFTRGQHQWL